jgi:hypothetical protein
MQGGMGEPRARYSDQCVDGREPGICCSNYRSCVHIQPITDTKFR